MQRGPLSIDQSDDDCTPLHSGLLVHRRAAESLLTPSHLFVAATVQRVSGFLRPFTFRAANEDADIE